MKLEDIFRPADKAELQHRAENMPDREWYVDFHPFLVKAKTSGAAMDQARYMIRSGRNLPEPAQAHDADDPAPGL